MIDGIHGTNSIYLRSQLGVVYVIWHFDLLEHQIYDIMELAEGGSINKDQSNVVLF
jgi:hypothetical protein